MTLNNQSKKTISLISDTGIQFFSLKKVCFDPNAEVIEKEIAFWEVVDVEKEIITLEFARRLDDYDVYVKENQLRFAGFVDAEDNLSEYININELETKDEEEVYSIYDLEEVLDVFANNWIPLPYFQSNSAGSFQDFPTNWARIMLIPESKHINKRYYNVVLAFDTCTKESKNDETPHFIHGKEVENFELCDVLTQILKYCNPSADFNWMEEYLKELDFAWKKREDIQESVEGQQPKLKYISRYIYFVKYLAELGVLPSINFVKYDIENAIDVDLVLDIGNSRTNGILIESPTSNTKAFEFTKVDILKIRDLTTFDSVYADPFSMRLAFQKVDFGEIGYQSKQFTWPSFVRLGLEAKNLIYSESANSNNEGKESTSFYSSPWSSPLLIRQNYRWLIESPYDAVSLQSDKTTDGDLCTAG